MKTINATEIVEFYNSMNLHQKEYLVTLLTNDLMIVVSDDGQVCYEPKFAKISINGTKVQIFLCDEED